MDLPATPPRPIAGMGADTGAGTAAMLSEALGAVPDEVLETRDHYLAVFAGQARVRDLAPDAGRLLALDRWAVIVTAPGDGVDFVSRFFAPRKGVMGEIGRASWGEGGCKYV